MGWAIIDRLTGQARIIRPKTTFSSELNVYETEYVRQFGVLPSRTDDIYPESDQFHGAIDGLLKHHSLTQLRKITIGGVDRDVAYINTSKRLILSVSRGYDTKKPMSVMAYHSGGSDTRSVVDGIFSTLSSVPANQLPPSVKIHLLCESNGSFYLREVDLKEPGKIDNYPEAFGGVHEKILSSLRSMRSGVVLLHGEPGTGKTSYIKYLSYLIPERKFIVIPLSLVQAITTPSFMSFMLNQNDSVLLFEDAESVIASREKGRSGPVAELLNLSDGLIGQSINCAVVATFNSSVSEIDPALLRKGRLIACHKFEKLSANEANRLLHKIGVTDITFSSPQTLAEVFNAKYDPPMEAAQKREAVGFRRSAY